MKECVSYFRVESSGTLGSILRGYKLRVEWEGELSLFDNEFVMFCINNQAQVSVHLSNGCFERVLEIF